MSTNQRGKDSIQKTREDVKTKRKSLGLLLMGGEVAQWSGHGLNLSRRHYKLYKVKGRVGT